MHRQRQRCIRWWGMAAVVLSLVTPATFAEDDGVRLGDTVVPTFEAIRLNVDADRADYTGSVRIELAVRKPARTFRFHAKEMELQAVTLQGKGGAVAVRHRPGEHDTIVVEADDELAPGNYTLEVKFTNDFNVHAESLYKVVVEGQGYVFTQFEAISAREAFPCWDEPAFKIPFQVTLTVPEDHLAVSNTPIDSETATEGRRTVVFARTRPIPSYLVAMATGPLETVPIKGMSVPGRVITVKGAGKLAGEAVRTTPPILAALEQYFGSKYPYRKLDLLAVPEFNAGAMENVGAVTYRDTILLIDPRAASDRQRVRMVSVTAHELAHMWFGDLVTMAWWDDTWLNESFATWMGTKIADQVFPEYNIAARSAKRVQYAMETDAQRVARAIREPVQTPTMGDSFDVLAYSKGGAVLGMFEHWLGKEVFRDGVRAYLKKHEWSNATAHDFWSALAAAAKVDIAVSMPTFFDQPGVPLVAVDLLDDGKVKLSQRRFLNYDAQTAATEPQLWQIPVELSWSDGKTTHTEKVLLKEKSKTIALKGGKPVWIHPNAGERGYYRWTLDRSLLMALVTEASDTLGVRERVALTGQLSALLDAGQIKGDEYLDILERLAGDPRPEVLEAVTDALGTVRKTFVSVDLEEAFAAYVRRLLRPALEHVGLRPRDGESETVKLFRPDLLNWLGTYGHDDEVLEFADAMAGKYVDDPTAVDASIAGACLRLAALRGDRKLYETYRTRFETAKVPAERSRFLSALGFFNDPALVDETLASVLGDSVRVHEMRSALFGLMRTPKNRDKVFSWVMDNYEPLTAKLPPMFKSFLPFFASGCSAERLEAAQEFFADPAHQGLGTQRQLTKVAESVTDCVSLREREGPAVAKYLRRTYAGE